VTPRSPARHAWARLLPALLLLALLAAGLFRAVPFRAEMSDLLPPGGTPGAEFLLGELRGGAATTVLLAAIEGAPEPELARLSRAVGDALRASGHFSFVGNGAQDFSEAERDLLFRYRYLLSPLADDPTIFTAENLRERLEALLDGLRSAASPLLARFGFADPAGAFLALLRGWLGEGQVALREGVWFAGEGPPRALLLARGAASGLDLDAQAAAVATFHEAFGKAEPGTARLLVSGPGVFGSAAAAAVRADVEMISLLSGLLIAAFLLWRYRSLLMLAAVAVPLLAGMLAGTAAVALVFGGVHGAAFGFGMTMLGVVADYPVLLVTQRRPGETLAAAARRIWPTLRLAAAAAALGLTAMLLSGFPLLAQLGLFGATGLLSGVAATRWLLPWLLPGESLRPRPLPAPLARALGALRGRRAVAVGAIGLAMAVLLRKGGPGWNDDLARLSPVPQAQRDLDTELRRQLGAPDVGALVALRGPDAESVLRAAGRVEAALSPLVARGALAGFDSPARYLPSAATQRARQAALPEPEAVRAHLAEAAAGMPFRPTAFDRFLDGLRESRGLPPLTAADLAAAPVLAARTGLMLSERGGEWQGLVVPKGLRDSAAVGAAIAALGAPDILYVDVKGETQGLVAAATAQALRWAALGGFGVLALLAIGLGRQRGGAGPGLRAALWTATPILGALAVTLAVLDLGGQRLTPFHLAALLLSAGVGMDYALFLGTNASASLPAAEAAAEADRTLGSVFNCTATTLLTFGLLAFCETSVLRGIGLTVSIGVAAAFLLAIALAPRPRSLP